MKNQEAVARRKTSPSWLFPTSPGISLAEVCKTSMKGSSRANPFRSNTKNTWLRVAYVCWDFPPHHPSLCLCHHLSPHQRAPLEGTRVRVVARRWYFSPATVDTI